MAKLKFSKVSLKSLSLKDKCVWVTCSFSKTK